MLDRTDAFIDAGSHAHDHPPRHPRARRAPEQPQGRRPRPAARRAARRHRRERVREVLARVRHRPRRRPAPLRRDLLLLRPPVPRPDGQAPVRRRRRHRRHPALHRHRPDQPGADLALHRRHHDRAQRPPEAAVRARRGAALPGLRGAGAPRHAALDHELDPRRRPRSDHGDIRRAGAREFLCGRDRPAAGGSGLHPGAPRTPRSHRSHRGPAPPGLRQLRAPRPRRRGDRARTECGPRPPHRLPARCAAPRPLAKALLDHAALRRLRHRVPGAAAEHVLVQLPAGRVRDLPRLRAHDGNRLRARRPRRVEDARRGGDSSVALEELPAVPAGPRALRAPPGGGARSPVAGARRRHPRMGPGGRGRFRRGRLVRGATVLRLARDQELPDAHPGAALALPELPGVPRVPRRAAQAPGAAVEGRHPCRREEGTGARSGAPPARCHAGRGRVRETAGTRHPRRDAPAARAVPEVLRRASPARAARRRDRAAAGRDPRAARISRRGGPRLSHPGPPVAHPERRRGPAHQPDHCARHVAREHALRARRAEHRAACARHRPHRLGAAQAARGRKHPAGGGARSPDHARGGPDRRHGAGPRRTGRRNRVPRLAARPAALAALAHRGVAARGATDRDARDGADDGALGTHRDPGSPRPQSRRHRRRHSAAAFRLCDRRQRLGQIDARRRGAAPRRVQAARARRRGAGRTPHDPGARSAGRCRARRPVVHRQDHPLEPRELRRRTGRDPQAVRGRTDRDRARIHRGNVQLQLRQRALPGLRRERLRARRDAVPERRVPALPRLRRPPLSKRSARREDPHDERCRRRDGNRQSR